MALVASQELILELRICFLSSTEQGMERSSDPNPDRSVKSDTFDIQELADKLQPGSNFYVLGISMGGYPTWGCLKYIPNRHENRMLASSVHESAIQLKILATL
ncbi:hypothetical protein DKX38_014798 [Salix brachista]|uniref:AB hydrolase-1 domain-containing protein n=1 Tax=Salix brachista TaxID=2182728 RepID=A0A5N5LG92_9ROSI|nr:hypothetical protein DKX38_014798 [Salix brachista]